MLSIFRHRQATRFSHSQRDIVRRIACVVNGLLLMLAIGACGLDAPPPFYLLCSEWGGRIEHRSLLDGSDLSVSYCVFADGTECHGRQFYYGTCVPPGASAPLSPLPTPIGGFGSPLGSGFAGFAPPPSLDELVDNASLIFIGTVGPVKQYLEVYGYYGEDGQLEFPGTDDQGTALPGWPVTDFILQVEEVIRDDGTIARGEPIVLRWLGHATERLKQASQEGEYPVSYTGDRYLFVLTPNPDGQSYGFYYGPWSRLIVDGDIQRVSNGAQQLLQFGDRGQSVTLEEFIQAVNGE